MCVRTLCTWNTSFRRYQKLYPRLKDVFSKANYCTGFKTHIGGKETTEEIADFKFTQHAYKHLYPWKSLRDFANCLTDSIVYNEGGIIAVNKPYGIAQRPMNEYVTDPKTVVGTLSSSSAGDAPYTLSEAIPFMKDILKVDDLKIVKSTDRYTSGIALLATTDVAKKTLEKGLAETKRKCNPPYTYWAVGIGPFAKESDEETVGISLLVLNEKNKEQQPVIEETFSKTRNKKREVVAVSVQYRTLSKSCGLPSVLFEISVNKTKWHFLRVYPAHKGVAVLGDNLYGSRVKWVFGKPVTISLFNNAILEAPTLPPPILRALEISRKMMVYIPTHLHLQRVTLGFKKGQEVVISAPPPRHFVYSCEKLGLDLSSEALKHEPEQNHRSSLVIA